MTPIQTAKEQVLQAHPNAICEKSDVTDNYLIVVYNPMGKEILGIGFDEEQAWKNAADRL